MSRWLAIETSTRHGSVAVEEEGVLVFSRTFTADRAHNSAIFGPLAEALECGPPNRLVVGTGPGSYSGIRVGIAAATGLALALGCPLAGLCSLLRPDLGVRYQVAGDARRGAWFLAEISGARLLAPPGLMEWEALQQALKPPAFTMDEDSPLKLPLLRPDAAQLLQVARALPPEDWTALASVSPEPLYLRPPHVTLPTGRAAQAAGR